jgi:predicted DNA-binding transcriptional regulator YafY
MLCQQSSMGQCLMRSSDRLFQIVLKIGHERIITGKRLAEILGVTTRTVYRDIRCLIASGVPIQGAAGVGYRLGRGYQIPPLMFTDEELQALHLGASIVRTWADAGLAGAAEQVLAKVDAVLPASSRPKLTYGAMIVPGGHVPTIIADHLSVLRGAINARRKVVLNYPRPFSRRADRIVRPLVLAYWGGSWTLGAWCESVSDFRTFRIDGISGLEVSSETFDDEPDHKLADYIAASSAHDAVLSGAVDALTSGSKLWPTAKIAMTQGI